MKTITHQIIHDNLNRMFDQHYGISVFTALPGGCDQEEVFTTQKGIQLKMKHVATYAALYASLYDNAAVDCHISASIKAILPRIAAEGRSFIDALEEAYSTLVDKLVQMN